MRSRILRIVLLLAFLLCLAGLHLASGARFSPPGLVLQALFDYESRNYQHVVIVKQTSDPHAEIERVDTETPMVLHAIAASLGARP